MWPCTRRVLRHNGQSAAKAGPAWYMWSEARRAWSAMCSDHKHVRRAPLASDAVHFDFATEGVFSNH